MDSPARKTSSGQEDTALEIDDDLEHQRHAWRFQRVGWIAIGVLLLAAVLGLFGKGPLSRSVIADSRHRIIIEYDRIARYETAFRLVIQLEALPESPRTARLWIDPRYARSLRIEQIAPDADRTETGADGLTYVFHVSAAPAIITVTGTMQDVGWVHGRVGTGPGDAVDFRQFVFP
jgi:hypothetical protein